MDTDTEIEALKKRVADLEKDNRELGIGLDWVIEELRKRGHLPPPRKP